MELKYTREALSDIENAQRYISVQLKNRNAAKKIVKEIVSSCEQLKAFPSLGKPLVSPNGVITKYRLLIIRNQIAIYEIREDMVVILRLLDGRMDYLRFIIGEENNVQ